MLFGLIAEWMMSRRHDNLNQISVAAVVYTLYMSTLGMAENFVFTDTYCDNALAHGINETIVEQMRSFYHIKPLWAAVIVSTAITTWLGTLLGKKIMSKHLKKAGIEQYVGEHYNNQICAAYGSSLGGSFVAQLAARGKIHMKYGIIGSSDFDQSGALAAKLKAALMGKVIYPFIHTGHYSSSFMQKRYEKQMASSDPYNKAFVAMVGRDKYDMSFITKQSTL